MGGRLSQPLGERQDRAQHPRCELHGRLLVEELDRLIRRDRSHLIAWAMHIPGAGLVLVWAVGVCAIPVARRRARATGSRPSRRISAARLSPSRCSITMKARPPTRSTRYTRTTLDGLLAVAKRASDQQCFNDSWSQWSSRGKTLTAIRLPVGISSAR